MSRWKSNLITAIYLIRFRVFLFSYVFISILCLRLSVGLCDDLTAGQSEAAALHYLPRVMANAVSADSGRRVRKGHPNRRCR